jgi:N12 class adenine-specific DNA methylase
MLLLKTEPCRAVLWPIYAVSRGHIKAKVTVIAECGAGKTLIALGSMLVHSAGRPICGLVVIMAPPHLVEKWARETFLTLPQMRVFLIDDMRNGGNPREPHELTAAAEKWAISAS